MNTNNILFIGAGPIGLSTAVQAKIRNPDLKITMLDKHESYTRAQKLRIDKSSFSGMPIHEELNEITKSFYSSKLVPIQDIESKLKDLAKKVGIQFKKRDVNYETFPEILNEFPDTGCIIGADGARSFVRGNIFGEEMNSMESVEYLVQVKYTTKGKTDSLHSLDQTVNLKLAATLVEESVSKSGEEVNLRFFVDQKTFKEIENAKAKEPWEITDGRVPQPLRKKIDLWIKARGSAYNEEIKDKPTLTGIVLNIYSAKDTVKLVDGRIYCLVGDAAGGVPFFRSINKGFIESSELSKTLAASPREAESTEQITSRFKVYENKSKSIAFWENLAAKVKSLFIDIIIGVIKVARFITPDVMIKWLEKRQLNFQNEIGVKFSRST